MKSLSFKKVRDGQPDIPMTIKYVFLFLQIIIQSQKNWWKTLKLKFILMFFDISYLIRPSDIVNKYKINPLSYWWKEYTNGLGSYFANLSYG